MGKIKGFEDIQAWQKARELTKLIYRITKNNQFSRDFDLRNQIRRAVVSMMSNIAEGFARRTNKEFISFLTISHGSAAEAQSHLYVALDQEYITEKEFLDIYSKIDEVSRMIQGFSNYLKNAKTL